MNITGQDDHGNNGWRQRFVQYAHLIPALCLSLDMMMNKIKIRPQQAKYQIIFNILYFLMTFFSQLNYTHPVYFNNLNWFGKTNFSYLIDVKN